MRAEVVSGWILEYWDTWVVCKGFKKLCLKSYRNIIIRKETTENKNAWKCIVLLRAVSPEAGLRNSLIYRNPWSLVKRLCFAYCLQKIKIQARVIQSTHRNTCWRDIRIKQTAQKFLKRKSFLFIQYFSYRCVFVHFTYSIKFKPRIGENEKNKNLVGPE